MVVSFFEEYLVNFVGKTGLAYFPLIATVFFFILASNYIGLLPGCISPTGNMNTTASWAIVVFIFYQIIGFKRHGFKYLKHFLGPVPVIAPIMFVMEIISQLARPLSLTIRLFANILAGEIIIYKILFPIAAIGLPVIWMLWESLITYPFQAFIFSLLTIIYIAGAVAADNEHETENSTAHHE
jgi:F-type H+-transporting ATPase subunit a